MLRGFALVGLTGCMTYQPGSFAHHTTAFPGEQATVGCLDIAVSRRDDYDKSAVLAYKFGNRCEYPQVIDLGGARVIGRDVAGSEHPLRPFDPKYQIRPLPVDARLVGSETIAYVADDNPGIELVQVCVDAGSVIAGQPARWMCFARHYEVPKDEPEDVPEDPGEPSLVHEEAA